MARRASHLTAKKAGLKAHIGAEVTCTAFSPRRHPSGGEFRLPLLAASACRTLVVRQNIRDPSIHKMLDQKRFAA